MTEAGCLLGGRPNGWKRESETMRDFMKKIILVLIVLSTAIAASFGLYAGGDPKSGVDPIISHNLKQYMSKFGTLVAGLEILKMKEKKPDWESIDHTLIEMNQTLSEMQKVDTTNSYKEYTDLLATSLADIKKMSQKQDKNIYDAFDKLTNTCFQCHAARRPSDFLKTKKSQQISGVN